VAFGHSFLALTNIARGLTEIDLNTRALAEDLANNWEVIGEAIQTVIRAEIVRGSSSITDPYAVVKDLTRGQKLGAEALRSFIATLDISSDAKERLAALTPGHYVGLADKLVDYLD
jgi:adenylosuccinate lyase